MDRIFQVVMLVTATVFTAFSAAILLMFVKVLGLLPSLGSAEKDMIYLFVGAFIGLIAGTVYSVRLARRNPYYVPHFLLIMFSVSIGLIILIGSLGRAFNLTV